MQVSYYAVHMPIRFLDSTRQKYDSRPPGERHAHAAHAAMTEDLDTGLGYLLDKMEELGIEQWSRASPGEPAFLSDSWINNSGRENVRERLLRVVVELDHSSHERARRKGVGRTGASSMDLM
jgi:hypothetical protein